MFTHPCKEHLYLTSQRKKKWHEQGTPSTSLGVWLEIVQVWQQFTVYINPKFRNMFLYSMYIFATHTHIQNVALLAIQDCVWIKKTGVNVNSVNIVKKEEAVFTIVMSHIECANNIPLYRCVNVTTLSYPWHHHLLDTFLTETDNSRV